MEQRWQGPTFATPRYERVHDLLRRLVSEGTAHFFADACELMQRQPPYRTATHIVSHLLREVEGAVREVLLKLPRAKAYLEANLPSDGSPPGGRTKIKAILHALDIQQDGAAAAWLEFDSSAGWHKTAHRDALRRPRARDEELERRVDRFVEVLSALLSAAEASYTDILGTLEAVCAKAVPSNEDAEVAAGHLAPGVTALAHAFGKLSAHWLVPLRNRRVFSEPPQPLTSDEGTVSFPSWPQAAYLVRIARELPDDVAATIEGIPFVDNESIHIEFLEAACRMPAVVAARVARHEARWLSTHHWHSGLLPDTVGNLAVNLLAGDQLDAALALLRPGLTLAYDERTGYRRPRMSPWSYGELVRKTMPALAAVSPAVARDLLIELIDAAAFDPTSSWRLFTRDGMPSEHGEPVDQLVLQLLASYEARAGRSAAELRFAVDELSAYGLPFYDQLTWQLIRKLGALSPELVEERVLAQLRRDHHNADEVVAMLRDRLSDLSPEGRARVLAALRESVSEVRLRAAFGEGAMDDAQLARTARQGLLRRFHGLGASRPQEIAAEYEALRAEFGEPEVRRGARIGPVAPRTAVELSALPDPELLAFLRNWEPEGNDPFEPSHEGLGEQLRNCARKEPARFSALAREFRGLPAPYVADLLLGVHEGIGRETGNDAAAVGPALAWDPLLDLLEWMVAQADAEPAAWTWAHRVAVNVAQDIAVAASKVDEPQLRRAWAVIRTLAEHPDPSQERDAQHEGDLETFSLNTVRGQALRAAIRIGVSLREPGAVAPGGMLEELIALVERRAEVEPSLAIRCVPATEFDTVYYVDPVCAARIAGSLFPSSEQRSEDRRAAWRCFLTWNTASTQTFGLLREAYRIAVSEVGNAETREGSKLGAHLVWLAFRQAIDLLRDPSLLLAFLRDAPSSVRHDALGDFGRSVHVSEEALDDATVVRLRGLWEWLADAPERRGIAAELATFGWWFTSRHFDPGWSLAQLERALAASGGVIDLDHKVIDKLAVLAPASPAPVAQCAALLVEQMDEWKVLRNRKGLHALLRSLLSTSAAVEARRIASRLVARGAPAFRDLALPLRGVMED